VKIQKFYTVLCSLIVCLVVSLTCSCDLEVAPGAKEMVTDSGTNGASEKVVIINNVTKIFMHQKDEYTYWYLKPETANVIWMYTLKSNKVTVILDAEKNKSWVKYWGLTGSGYSCAYQEMHLDSVDIVGGAGWVRQDGDDTIKGFTSVVK